jgi:redox-sensitive bicupin YhaK (pirin superfamily)
MKNQAVKERGIKQVGESFTTLEGPGIPIRRPLPSRTVKLEDVDPMLLLDHGDIEEMPRLFAGQGTHRHRGFEVITYVTEGHLDDQPGDGPIQRVEKGGLQRITAGSGISHGGAPSEGGGGPVGALQIWINLAQKDKKADPEAQVVAPAELPVVETDSALTRVLAGPGSPTRLLTPALMLDVKVKAGGAFEWDVPEAYQGYVYLLKGEGAYAADGTPVRETQIAVLGEGGRLKAKAGAQGLRFFLAAGRPHREPIRWSGPYVD